jgi:hypothetical protein
MHVYIYMYVCIYMYVYVTYLCLFRLVRHYGVSVLCVRNACFLQNSHGYVHLAVYIVSI